MTRGPERLRLDAALDEADAQAVGVTGAGGWGDAITKLGDVSKALRQAAASGLGIGGRTGPAMFEAMQRSADNIDARVALFVDGQRALHDSAGLIEDIRTKRDRIDTDPATAPLPDPGSFSDNPEWDDKTRLAKQGEHASAVNAYHEREALREQKAREIAEEYDRRYEEPIATMKKIHGIPDPEEPTRGDGTGGSGGSGGGTPGGRGTGSGGHAQLTHHGTGYVVDDDGGDGGRGDRDPDVTTHPPKDPIDITCGPWPDLDPSTVGPGTPTTTSPVGPGTIGGGSLVPGGTSTAVGVGLGGGALLGGLAKGGSFLGSSIRGLGAGLVPGASQSRPLGGLSRSAVSGTLGRGPVSGVSATGGPAGRGGVGAASSAGRPGSARTGGAGTRGGARGAAGGSRTGGAGGRGRGKRREGDGPDREFYEDDGSEWLDDEAAPGVLD